ncbi:MAG: SDR family NAD(P)-dependent oxidoreductase, partial [Actinomycetota bacterium]
FWVTKAFLGDMVARNSGHVVTIASASGLLGVSRMVEYASSKHAAVGFDESLRMELAEVAPGVRTTVVNPFFIDTGMFEGVRSRVPFLLPILAEAEVAKAVVVAVERNRSVVNLPRLVGLLAPMRILPVKAFDAAIGLLGVNDTMKTFHGRAPQPEPVDAD